MSEDKKMSSMLSPGTNSDDNNPTIRMLTSASKLTPFEKGYVFPFTCYSFVDHFAHAIIDSMIYSGSSTGTPRIDSLSVISFCHRTGRPRMLGYTAIESYSEGARQFKPRAPFLTKKLATSPSYLSYVT